MNTTIDVSYLILNYKSSKELIPLSKNKEIHPTVSVNPNAFLDILSQYLKKNEYLSLKRCDNYINILTRWKKTIDDNFIAIYIRFFAYNKICALRKSIINLRRQIHSPWELIKLKYKYFDEQTDYGEVAATIFKILFNKRAKLINADETAILEWIFKDDAFITLAPSIVQKDKIKKYFTEIIFHLKITLAKNKKIFKISDEFEAYKVWSKIVFQTILDLNSRVKSKFSNSINYEDNFNRTIEDTPEYRIGRKRGLENLPIDSLAFKVLEDIDKFIESYSIQSDKNKFKRFYPQEYDNAIYYPFEYESSNLIEEAKSGDIILFLRKIQRDNLSEVDIKEPLLRRFSNKLIPMHLNHKELKSMWVFKINIPNQPPIIKN